MFNISQPMEEPKESRYQTNEGEPSNALYNDSSSPCLKDQYLDPGATYQMSGLDKSNDQTQNFSILSDLDHHNDTLQKIDKHRQYKLEKSILGLGSM
mmetsp:Transcript_5638/g.5155  ORF Transcript_5638/g.5155 Transcript_5638/m.5155 type:complete len:97 (-) Transcript_5638:279-569(-)